MLACSVSTNRQTRSGTQAGYALAQGNTASTQTGHIGTPQNSGSISEESAPGELQSRCCGDLSIAGCNKFEVDKTARPSLRSWLPDRMYSLGYSGGIFKGCIALPRLWHDVVSYQ